MIKFSLLVVLSLGLTFPVLAGAQNTQNIIVDDHAVLHFCPKAAADCGGVSITVDGHGYRATAENDATNTELLNIEGAYEFQNMTTSLPFHVEGYVKTVTNNNPFGPRGEVQVFVITSGLENLPVPK